MNVHRMRFHRLTFILPSRFQTKYVPLNRQTIYNRQFRQHEPSIESLENIAINGLQHHKLPKQKIVISASSVNAKRNGHTNGVSKSPRTSPKFFKSHQLQPAPDGQYSTNHSTTHHSITVSSSHPAPAQQNSATQFAHVAATCENGINNITGIKQGPANGKCHSSRGNSGKLKSGHNGKGQPKVASQKKIQSELIQLTKPIRQQHRNVTVEPVTLALRSEPTVHLDLDVSIFQVPLLSPLHHLESETAQTFSRDDRLSQRKLQLRRRVQHFKGIRHYRTTEQSKVRFCKTLRLLKHFDCAKQEM